MEFDYMQAMKDRHSVRKYLPDPIPGASIAALDDEIARCNAEGGLSMQLITEQPDAFKGFFATYGMLSGV